MTSSLPDCVKQAGTLVRGTKKAPEEWSFFYFIMITVYVLRSLRSEIYYTGMTQNLDNRLKEHNSGKSKFTSGHLPWTVIYSELHADWATGVTTFEWTKKLRDLSINFKS